MDALHLHNDINEVPLLAEWCDLIGEETGLAMDKVFQLNLAMEEAVVNVMNYAYPGQEGMPIHVTATDNGDTITLVIDDEGLEFDPTQAEDPDLTLSAEERPIGGLGIMLVRQFMSDVNYKRIDGHNVLTLVMKK